LTLPALPGPYAPGDTPLASELNAIIDNVEFAVDPTYAQCVLQLNAYKAVAHNTTTVISWDSARIDNEGMWSSATPSVATIRTSGLYTLGLQAILNGTVGTGHMWGFVTVNGTNIATDSEVFLGTSGDGRAAAGSQPQRLVAGDVIRGYVHQTSGGSLSLQNDYGGTKLSIMRIAP
jgi:altronate dehydratase